MQKRDCSADFKGNQVAACRDELCSSVIYGFVYSDGRTQFVPTIMGNRPTFFSKGNRPIRRRGVRNGEIQLDLKPQGLLFLPPSYFFVYYVENLYYVRLE